MKRLATIAMFLMMALPLLAAPAAAKPGDNGGPGNSGAAHACQGDGYLDYTRADGSTFANTGECASYGAQGGVLVEVTEGGGNEGGGEEGGGDNEGSGGGDEGGGGDEANDADNDGAEDGSDNCPALANPGQADIDNDGTGDACDDDRDGDGVDNGDDVWPDDPSRADDSDFSTDQTVTLSKGSNCTLVVSVSGFEPGTYDGTLSSSGIEFSITVGDGGTGVSEPIGNSVVLTNGATYTATVGGIESVGYTFLCSAPVPIPGG